MKILVIIPAYNEEKNIVKTVNQLKNTKLKQENKLNEKNNIFIYLFRKLKIKN